MSIMILWMIFRDFHYFHDYDNLPGQSGSLREPTAEKNQVKTNQNSSWSQQLS